MTLTRRSLLLASAAFASLVTLRVPAEAQAASAATATQFIDGFGRQLISVVDAGGSKDQKLQAMRPLIEQSVAVDEIGQFCLGQYWRTASAEQRQRFLAVFHQVLLNNIGAKLGEFRGVTYRLTQTQARDGSFFVGTLITRPNQQPNNVQWVVSFASGGPKIIDVYAEGTSLRLTQRSDYTSYLARNGNNVDALLTALERQVAA